MLRSVRWFLLLVLPIVLGAPAVAHADVFFADKGGSGTQCSEAAPCATISAALTASRNAAGTGDRIEVGPGLFVERVVIDKAEDAGLTLHGSGRGADEAGTPPDATTVRPPESNKGAEVAVGVAAGVSLEAMRVEVPAGFVNTAGISLGGAEATVRTVHVQSAGGINTDAITVTSNVPDVDILDARVRHTGSYRGIAIFGPRATIADSDVSTASGQALDTEGFGAQTRVLRSKIHSDGGYAATIRTASNVIASSLLTGGAVEVYAGASSANSLLLSNATIDVGEAKIADGGQVATRARAESGGTATVSLRNSIALEKQQVEGNSVATVKCTASIAPPQEESVASGTVECGPTTENLFAPTSQVFVDGLDWHLRPGSPAVDSGLEGELPSETDLDGLPRILDGNGDGNAVIDRGAYELPTPGPAPIGGEVPAPSVVLELRLGKLKRNRHAGRARLRVEAPGPGELVLRGRGVKRYALESTRAGSYWLRVIPRPKLARRLRARHVARTAITVVFTPTGGVREARHRKLKLIRRARRAAAG